MKKIVFIATITCVSVLFSSCGPSEANKKAEEEKIKMEADSIKNTIKEDIASEMDSLKKDNKTSDSLLKVEKK
jgi:ABC-type Fe3+-citrate transport system substrate-binding protein